MFWFWIATAFVGGLVTGAVGMLIYVGAKVNEAFGGGLGL